MWTTGKTFRFLCAAAAGAAGLGTAQGADRATLADMSFLAGCWGTPKGDTPEMRECYTMPKAGLMQGSGQHIENGKTVFFEFMILSEENGVVSYTPLPNGQRGPAFPLVSFDGTTAVFENMAHDFPKRIIYRKSADGALTARIEGATADAPGSEEWVMRPQGP